MATISVLEGWGYAVGLVRYYLEAVLPGVLVIVVGGAIGEFGGPEWLGLLVAAAGGVIVLLGTVATMYKLVVDGAVRAIAGTDAG